jgi:hypothetical protein
LHSARLAPAQPYVRNRPGERGLGAGFAQRPGLGSPGRRPAQTRAGPNTCWAITTRRDGGACRWRAPPATTGPKAGSRLGSDTAVPRRPDRRRLVLGGPQHLRLAELWLFAASPLPGPTAAAPQHATTEGGTELTRNHHRCQNAVILRARAVRAVAARCPQARCRNRLLTSAGAGGDLAACRPCAGRLAR